MKPPIAHPFKYKSQYGIVVVCEDENDQAEKYAQLQKLGLKLKVVCV